MGDFASYFTLLAWFTVFNKYILFHPLPPQAMLKYLNCPKNSFKLYLHHFHRGMNPPHPLLQFSLFRQSWSKIIAKPLSPQAKLSFLKKHGCKHKSYPANKVFWQAHTLSYHIIPLDKFPTDRPTQAPANSAGSGLSWLQPIYSAKPSLSGSGYLFDSPD